MNTRRVFALVAFGALLGLDVPQADAQNIDQNFYYKLSTQFRGIEWKLDVFNSGPKNNETWLEPDQNVSGQFWRFTHNADGTFRLTTLFRGPNMCLDIFNGGPNNNEPHLASCANFSGQSWRLRQNADGTFRLTTLFRGPNMCLDIFNGGPKNNQPHLASCANLSGQIWTLTKTSRRVSSSYACAHCNDGSCQCGSFTSSRAELCANHNGEDPSIGCSQQQ
jgi:Ricin-type beta-trefoil lectin domain-like